MEGRHFAVLSSIGLWCITYIIGFLIISNKFSKGYLFIKITSKFKIYRTIFITTILLPFFAGVSYNIGGKMERGNSIAWGCYIEEFSFCLIIWMFFGIILFLMVIYGLINPNKLKFKKRLYLFLACLIIQSYGLLMIFIYGIFINYFSGDLSGKESTCW